MVERGPEAVNFPAQYDLEVPPVSVGHEAIQFRARLFSARLFPSEASATFANNAA